VKTIYISQQLWGHKHTHTTNACRLGLQVAFPTKRQMWLVSSPEDGKPTAVAATFFVKLLAEIKSTRTTSTSFFEKLLSYSI